MLNKLTIKRFKSIYDAELEFGRVNLFIGPNGSGKSNVLEALGILSAALSRGLDPVMLDAKGVRLSLPQLFKSAFKNTKLSPQFRLEAHFENGRYECSIRANTKQSRLEFHSEALYQGKQKIFGRSPNGVKLNKHFIPIDVNEMGTISASRSVWDVIAPFASVTEDLRDELAQLANFTIYSPQTAVMRGLAIDNRPSEPLGLTGAGLALAFENVLDHVKELPKNDQAAFEKVMSLIWTPGWANQIRLSPFDTDIVPNHVKSDGLLLYIRDKFMKTNRNYLSTYDASEGTLYLIFVVTLLLHTNTPKTFSLDNVDGTLNPALVRKLTDAIVKACVKKESSPETYAYQAFVTSHHPSSLDSFDIFSESEAIFVTKRSESGVARGSTTFERLRPPKNKTKDQWISETEGRALSVFLLDGKIDGALK